MQGLYPVLLEMNKLDEYLAKICALGVNVTADDVVFGGFPLDKMVGEKSLDKSHYLLLQKIYLMLLVCKFLPAQIPMAEAVIFDPRTEAAILSSFVKIGYETSDALDAFLCRNYIEPRSSQAVFTSDPARLADSTYQRAELQLHLCSNYLLDCVSKQNQQKIYSPYGLVAQSSGYGKTRMALEISNDPRFVVVYMCLRATTDVRTSNARRCCIADFVDELFDEPHFMAFVLSIFKELATNKSIDQIERLSANLLLDQSFERQFWTQVEVDARNSIEKINRAIASANEASTESLAVRSLSDQLTSGIKVVQERFGEGRKVILVFDEATSLLREGEPGKSPFLAMREALRHTVDTVALLIDTAPSISRFLPPRNRDPSPLLREQSEVDLFAPFTSMVTMGAIPLCKELRDKGRIVEGGAPYASLQYAPLELVALGRPLFVDEINYCASHLGWSAAQAESHILQHAANHLAFTAAGERRIRAGLADPFQAVAMIDLAAIAIRLWLSVENADLSTQLSGSLLATIMEVTADRQLIKTIYPSEPLLAECAAHRLWRQGAFSRSLENLRRFLQRGFKMPQGDAGELVAALLLLRTQDFAIEALPDCRASLLQTVVEGQPNHFVFSTPIMLAGFLKVLFPSPSVYQSHLSAVSPSLQAAFLTFTHFVKVDNYTPTRATLLEAFNRRAALACKPFQEGVDLLIPLVVPPIRREGKDASEQSFIPTEQNIGCMLIQVKNLYRAEPIYTGEAKRIISSIHPKSLVGLGVAPDLCLGLLLQVGTTPFIPKTPLVTDSGIPVFILAGLHSSTFPFLSPDQLEYLADIARPSYGVDPLIVRSLMVPLSVLPTLPAAHKNNQRERRKRPRNQIRNDK